MADTGRKKSRGQRGISRRALLFGAAGSVAAASAAAQTPKLEPGVPPAQGLTELGERSPHVQPKRRIMSRASSATPHQDLTGTITPSDLHFERHHSGVPNIDPATYELLVHGLVDRPTMFSLDDLKRLPSTSRVCFIECAGNFARNAPPNVTPQIIAGLTSQSEWTGVLLSTLLREVGVQTAAAWMLAEGQDAGLMARSIPLARTRAEAIIAYAQNGEPLRPAQGYPVRLVLPGLEGNMQIKWLRRLELRTQPAMTREETAHYTEPMADGTVRMFSFTIEPRSIITDPVFPATITRGWREIRGIAWSGNGRIRRVDVSVDNGATWSPAALQEPVLAKAHTRFRFAWNWTGAEANILSRAVDETGAAQPTLRELIAARGVGSVPYHLNPITGWVVRTDGSVVYRTEYWQ